MALTVAIYGFGIDTCSHIYLFRILGFIVFCFTTLAIQVIEKI